MRLDHVTAWRLADVQRALDYVVALGSIDHPAPPNGYRPTGSASTLTPCACGNSPQAVQASCRCWSLRHLPGTARRLQTTKKDAALAETMLVYDTRHLLVTDWKPATAEMLDFDIETYLAGQCNNENLVEFLSLDMALTQSMVITVLAYGISPAPRARTMADIDTLPHAQRASPAQVWELIERAQLSGLGCGLVDVTLVASQC